MAFEVTAVVEATGAEVLVTVAGGSTRVWDLKALIVDESSFTKRDQFDLYRRDAVGEHKLGAHDVVKPGTPHSPVELFIKPSAGACGGACVRGDEGAVWRAGG